MHCSPVEIEIAPEEETGVLLDELTLAVQWQRPCLVIAVYRSEFRRRSLQDQIAQALSRLGQASAAFIINRDRADVPVLLSMDPDHSHTVYHVSGLGWGGGRGGREAYRALNLHREYFVDHQVRAIFWLTRSEAALLPRCAPDFWAFRHRVFEFMGLPDGARSGRETGELVLEPWQPLKGSRAVEDEIATQEQLLAGLPEGPGSRSMRLEVHGRLACLHHQAGGHAAALRHVRLGTQMARGLGDMAAQVSFLNEKGIIELSRRQFDRALGAFEEARSMDGSHAATWGNLSVALLRSGDFENAVHAAEQATRFAPEKGDAWLLRGRVLHDLGLFEEAASAYRKAARLVPGDGRPWAFLGDLYQEWGNSRLSARCLRKSLRLQS